ncbi:MAG: type IV pilus biogenesis/stability protein PilW [Thiobacillus sp.]
MKKWIVMAAVLLGGCVGQPMGGGDGGGNVTGSQADSESRQRARAFTDLAAAYFNRAQYKIALDELRKAITADNRYGPAYNVYGLIYMELAEDKLAEENFRRAIELDRNDSEARNNFGWFLCARGRFDLGQEQFSAALRNPLYSQPEQAMANAGLCAEKKGDYALAEANFVKSLKLQPDNAGTVLKLAGLNFRQGKLEDTRRLLGRHAELAPPTAESLWLGVRLERKLGDRAQEAAYGLQLRKRFPDSDETRRLMAGQFE